MLVDQPACPSGPPPSSCLSVDLTALLSCTLPLPAPRTAGVLPELLPLEELLVGSQDWQRDAAGVAALIMGCLNRVAAAYSKAGDPVSAAILLEASLRK